MRQQERTDHAEHGGVNGDTKCQRGNGGNGKAGRFDQLAQRESDVRKEAFRCRPLPYLAATLFNQADVAKLAARSLLCLHPRHAAVHELFRLFGDVFVDGDCKVFVAATPGEQLR
jgi:hypothetical protein